MSIFGREKTPISAKNFGSVAKDFSQKDGKRMTKDDLSAYELDESIEFAGCAVLCEKVWDEEMIAHFKRNVGLNYGYNMYLDDLPAAVQMHHDKEYGSKIPIGYLKGDEAAIYNHLDITVKTHNSFLSEHLNNPTATEFKQDIEIAGGFKFKVTLPAGTVRIVSFSVKPRSIVHDK